MRTKHLIIPLMLALFLTGLVLVPQAQASDAIPGYQGPGFADMAEELLPSVVNISSTQKMEKMEDLPDFPQFPPGSPFEDFFEQFMKRHGPGIPMIPPASLGSGFVIDVEQGYIVTNNHVVRDADEVRVTFHDDSTVEAEVVGRDEKMDLAVLKVDTSDIKDIKAVSFGNSDTLRVGEWVLAIGNPFGLGGTVTAGIVSARQRDINAGPYDDFIQTDASINRGNSGGPMFDLEGNVIGINTAIYSPSGGSVGIGFAIPSNLAEPVIKQLIEYGRTRRGWLGVRIQTVTDEIAESLGLNKARGALVSSLTPTGPAEEAGLKPGDIILEFDGQKIPEMRTLPRLVAATPIGKEAPIVYWRDDKKHTTKVKIGELEKAEEEGLITDGGDFIQDDSPDKGKSIEMLGLTLEEITPSLREEFGLADDLTGIIVTDIAPGSAAARKMGIGDVIVEVNQSSVESLAAFNETIEKAKKDGRTSVLLLVSRDSDVRFVALRLDTEDKENKK